MTTYCHKAPRARTRTNTGKQRLANIRLATTDTGMKLETVAPVRPPAAYVGGKKLLAKTIVKHINQIPHLSYAEPFVGMGGVFFRRTAKARSELINDYNADVANLFRVLQRHYGPFLEELQYQLTSRREFARLSATDPDTLTDIERAARFLYLQKVAYGAKVVQQAFGVEPAGNPARFNVTRLTRVLEAVRRRLYGVVIECLPFQEFIRVYDHPATLFYLDPPYWGSEGRYGHDLFCRADFAALSEQLADIKGRFILSLNDVPEVRRLFKRFHVCPVPVCYSLSHKGGKWTGELLISNVPF